MSPLSASTTPSWLGPLLLLLVAHPVMAALPLVDFDRMGSVGLGGAFAGMDLFNNSSDLAFDPATSTLLARAANGSLARLASTNQGGAIVAGCALGDTFYLAGSFSSIGDTAAANIASYAASSFAALGANGPNGEIRALFCDDKNDKVWAGGAFTSPSSAVAVWDPKAASWSPPPFAGLAGAAAQVLSITANTSLSSLFFSGSFVTSFQANGTALNASNHNPNVPFSAGATPYSSSLVPIPLEKAQIQGAPASSDPSYSNIENILCPAGGDGAGQTWLGADGSTAQITARAFEFISASGIRLGNTFLNGRSTTAFSLTSIPDNTVRQLHYVDPITGDSRTCTDNCPLSTDASIPYQDFTFDSVLDLTGVQVTLSAWQGAGPGLHLFQLLSSGAFVSANSSDNGLSCFAPVASNTSQVGTWTPVSVNTNIPGTTQSVLVASADVGTASSNAPSFTWQPYVSASGTYNISMLVPGCVNFQDCAARTSVKVTVFPGGGQQPVVTVIPQTNTEDASPNIYSGSVVSTTSDFGSGDNGKYQLVADRVQLVLDANATAGGTSTNGGSNGTTTASTRGSFGFFEWPLSAPSVNAQTVLANATQTAADAIGIQLFAALGGNGSLASSSNGPSIAAVAHHASGAVVVAGAFALSSPSTNNIAIFKNGALSAVAGGGLNGPVTSLVLDGDKLFVGGSFSDTGAASTQGALRGIAVYDVARDAWTALEGGVNGAVSSLGYEDGTVQVAGNFTTLLSSAGSTTAGQASAGFAVWNVTSSAWANSGGFLVGSMSFVANGTAPAKGQKQTQFIAGSVSSALKFGASGFVSLKNGNDGGQPQIVPLGVQLDDQVAAASSASASTQRRRSTVHKRSSWLAHVGVRHLFKRQTSTSSLAALPAPPAAPAPAVLAGAFWTNTSTSVELTVLGGNFSFASGGTESTAVAFYDPSSGTVSALQGAQPNGTVRALLVQGTRLFVGGEFTLPQTSANGFAVYDLIGRKWETDGVQALQANAGASVVVRSITASDAKDGSVVVAGSFAQAGSVACQGICLLDAVTKQWSALGDGIQGEVASVDYAGANQGILVAAGSIGLSGSTASNVLQFAFGNSSWSTVGDSSTIPGPVTAVTVNNRNGSSIFAAGKSSDGSASFLSFWDGHAWTSLSSTLQPSTEVSQLTMVPLQDTHGANGVIEPDRMLLVSGVLEDSSFGNASSALFDGSSFIPYIVASSATGGSGAVSALFHSLASFSFSQHHVLATGIVILISIAIAAGVVFLLVLIGILWTLFSRRDESLAKFDPAEVDEDDASAQGRPSSLLAHINAATRTTILGSPYSPYDAEKDDALAGAPSGSGAGAGRASAAGHGDPFSGPDASNYLRSETPMDAIAGLMAGEEEAGRPAHVRYSFDGTGEGELPLSVGQELEVLDDRDHSWWYARDLRTGQEGVVPAAYLY
ncbi:cortical protein marker for cell polarity-domain-containing protein [Amylostereum chailletii]|nr:cortical protein marker for cell polarity-domain-containing protein [Amylostereum chailletii]